MKPFTRILSGAFFWGGLLGLILFSYNPEKWGNWVNFSNPLFVASFMVWVINIVYYIVNSR